MIFFSIIVPVFNAANKLAKCIKTITNQTYTNFELLLIDDGSSDGSGKLCDEYAALDKRIKVIHKKNGGVSSARNEGINVAKGEYSIHVDADDYIEEDMLENIYVKIIESNADIIIMDYYRDEKRKCLYVRQAVPSTGKECLISILKGNMMGAMWNKVIRHSLYKKFSLHFNEKIHYCEDVLLLSQLFLQPIKIKSLNKAFYHYVYSQYSITCNPSRNVIQSRILFTDKINSILKVFPLPSDLLEKHKWGIMLDIIKNTSYTKKEFDGLYLDIYINKKKNISKKEKYIIQFASYNRLSWVIIKYFFKIKKKVK